VDFNFFQVLKSLMHIPDLQIKGSLFALQGDFDPNSDSLLKGTGSLMHFDITD
jgi:hypothetical protein